MDNYFSEDHLWKTQPLMENRLLGEAASVRSADYPTSGLTSGDRVAAARRIRRRRGVSVGGATLSRIRIVQDAPVVLHDEVAGEDEFSHSEFNRLGPPAGMGQSHGIG